MGVDRQLSPSFHVPDDGLVQRKALAGKYFRRIGGGNDSADLGAGIDLLDNSFSVFPQFQHSIPIASS